MNLKVKFRHFLWIVLKSLNNKSEIVKKLKNTLQMILEEKIKYNYWSKLSVMRKYQDFFMKGYS